MPIDKNILNQFYGSGECYPFSDHFPNLLLSDGAKYIAENGGTDGAMWLMVLIGSYQLQAMKHASLREMQIWKLTVSNGSGGLIECRADSSKKPLFIQRLKFTDFDLPEIDLWVRPLSETKFVIMLPSEH